MSVKCGKSSIMSGQGLWEVCLTRGSHWGGSAWDLSNVLSSPYLGRQEAALHQPRLWFLPCHRLLWLQARRRSCLFLETPEHPCVQLPIPPAPHSCRLLPTWKAAWVAALSALWSWVRFDGSFWCAYGVRLLSRPLLSPPVIIQSFTFKFTPKTLFNSCRHNQAV